MMLQYMLPCIIMHAIHAEKKMLCYLIASSTEVGGGVKRFSINEVSYMSRHIYVYGFYYRLQS